jgi:ribonucleoside-diphosphate reductase alpha chain
MPKTLKTISKQVIKVSGAKENFDSEKIYKSIWLAAQSVGGKNTGLAKFLKGEVVGILGEKYPNGEFVATTEIGELVEKVLIEKGHAQTAKAYIRYRENKKNLKQDKDSLGITDDIGLSYNTLYILKSRYLMRNEKAETIETPLGMVKRVAKYLSNVEKTEELQEKWNEEFYNIMANFEFLPGTRTLANSGKREAQLANCFVFDIDDDIDDIFNTLHKSTLIKKHGGGCGYNFSKIRPEGDGVGGVPNLAAGPVKMIEMFDLMTSLFRQEGRYESGNMAILDVDHPDIFNFISAKQNDGYLSKTNISVGITDEFMNAVISDKDWSLINPRTKEVVNKVSARSILELMSSMAWGSGDPGLINLSAINRGTKLANPLLKEKGPIVTTNVCGEIPCYPYESCNLGYLDFSRFVKESKFDFSRFKKVVRVAIRLLDNVIDASWFPVREVEKAVRSHRRLGLGGVGWAEALIKLGIPYDSPEAFKYAEKIAKTMYLTAFDASCELAQEKGPFPLVSESIWATRMNKPRNVALLTFPPSSGNAVICETSYGIEPLFALAYEQNVLDGMRFKNVNQLFIRKLKEANVYSEALIQKIIENNGSTQGIKEVPKNLQKIFRVAHDIDWRDHIKMQAAFQKWTDNAITKTINMPSNATPNDIEEAFILAWKLGCKGLTVYRDKTKADQVIDFGGGKDAYEKVKLCPTCDSKLVKDGKCLKCKRCGFSTCDL